MAFRVTNEILRQPAGVMAGLLLVWLFSLGGCAGGGGAEEPSVAEAKVNVEGEAPPAPSAAAQADQPKDGTPTNIRVQAPAQRLVVRTGDVRVRADDVEAAATQAQALADRLGGYVSSSNLQQYSGNLVRRITLRVPSQSFDQLLTGVKALGNYVQNEQINALDVTEEFVDNESRLKARRAQEEQYLAVLRRANTVEEILQVQRHLADVREEIERTEGRQRYLQNQASLSTLNVEFYKDVPTTYDRPGFFTRVGRGVVEGWEVLLNLLVGIITLWPILLILAGIIWLILRAARRTKLKEEARRQQATRPPPPPAA